MAVSWAASALEWWEEAGVDTIVGEVPHDWLNPKAAARAAPVADALPDNLEAFQAWLATSADIPLASPAAPRATPAGDPASGLMVLVDMPSTDGGLLGGEAGALFDRMMAAIGRGRDTIYLAPLSPARTPTGSIDAASGARLGEIARHHVGLVAPKALLLFGDLCGKALLGLAVAEGRAKWHQVVTPAGSIKTLVTIRPEKLVDRPAFKKYVWEDLQMLKEELTP
ncbi:MAG TPA: uracil-DNA glycosylase [Allosphingosinicella sp.]|nr:uracil-DNA glycosylase [Allosphingosinicella sp.]